MRTKPIALALAVALALGGSGLVAADYASSDRTDALTPKNDAQTTDGSNATRLTADESVEITMSSENVSLVDTDAGPDIEVVDENDELTDGERETVRSLVDDGNVSEELRNRFGDAETVTLTVHGVGPDEAVHMDATAPGDNPETVVVADLRDETVSVEGAALVSADSVTEIDLDSENVTVKTATADDAG
jgi:hypothetical protein